jgi:hypothetical protein
MNLFGVSVDRGSIEWHPGEICVIGRNIHRLVDVSALSLVSPPFLGLGLILANIAIVGMSFLGCYSQLTPTNPVTWVTLALLNVLWFLSTITTKWIKVSYREQSGLEVTAYLLPVSANGWRRFDGASQRLLELLKQKVPVTRTPSGVL